MYDDENRLIEMRTDTVSHRGGGAVQDALDLRWSGPGAGADGLRLVGQRLGCLPQGDVRDPRERFPTEAGRTRCARALTEH